MSRPLALRRRTTGAAVELDPDAPLGEGGEALVYAVAAEPRLVAKVYKRPSHEHADKLALMIGSPPHDPTRAQGHVAIVWPEDLLDHAGGGFAGFLMPRFDDMRRVCDLYTPRERRRSAPAFTYPYLHTTAQNLAAVIRAVHGRGYVVGDVNESNVLVNDRSLVTLVDTDSFQVRDSASGRHFRCAVGKPEFTPPELQGASFAAHDRAPHHDLFGLAVLVFQLLCEGQHPFAGRFTGSGEAPDLGQRIAAGHFVHARSRRVPYVPAPAALPFASLDPRLQDLFVRCFDGGHATPQLRPTADEWLAALAEAAGRLRTCAANARHAYYAHRATCVWCERTAALGGVDPFSATAAVARTPRQPWAQRPARATPTRTARVAPHQPVVPQGAGPIPASALAPPTAPPPAAPATAAPTAAILTSTDGAANIAAVLIVMVIAYVGGWANPVLGFVGLVPVCAMAAFPSFVGKTPSGCGCAVILFAGIALWIGLGDHTLHPIFSTFGAGTLTALAAWRVLGSVPLGSWRRACARGAVVFLPFLLALTLRPSSTPVRSERTAAAADSVRADSIRADSIRAEARADSVRAEARADSVRNAARVDSAWTELLTAQRSDAADRARGWCDRGGGAPAVDSLCTLSLNLPSELYLGMSEDTLDALGAVREDGWDGPLMEQWRWWTVPLRTRPGRPEYHRVLTDGTRVCVITRTARSSIGTAARGPGFREEFQRAVAAIGARYGPPADIDSAGDPATARWTHRSAAQPRGRVQLIKIKRHSAWWLVATIALGNLDLCPWWQP